MTTVYGVTKFGARLQIAKQLKDIDDFPKEHVWAASLYLTSEFFVTFVICTALQKNLGCNKLLKGAQRIIRKYFQFWKISPRGGTNNFN